MSTNDFPSGGLHITNSTLADIDFIFKLFDSAIDYQTRNKYELWPQFSKQLIETEVAEKRHWKILDGNTIVCVFSVLYTDPVIWGEKDKEPSVYLHRIAINPLYKGKGIMNLVKNWAIQHAIEKDRKYVRMDTWGNNEKLRRYYVNCGFNYLGQQHLKEAHYGGSVLSLFQVEV